MVVMESMSEFPRLSPYSTFLLHDPALNKGTAFSEKERDALGLRGLLPARVHTMEEQLARVLANVRSKSSDLERYIFLIGLQDRNETLFYRLLADHLEELMPIIYTPTVGQACQEYGHIFRRPRGLFISARDAGRVRSVLSNWATNQVRVIVVTDGGRILGLGDLGADGMGIPVGKLTLYTACAGIHPSTCLPVTIDAGTNNPLLLNDPLYIGLEQPRLDGPAYDDLVDEFVNAAQELFPGVLIQFEDFGTQNAFRLLNKYRTKVCAFNDDMQGTAAVVLAGIYSTLRITRQRIVDQRFLLIGAGQAGIGIADLLVDAMVEEGLSEAEARARCWFIDSKGLVVRTRADLAERKIRYAQDRERMEDPLAVMDALRPTALIGVSGRAGAFTREILTRMGEVNARPVIFALSNPTSKAECSAEAAYRATNGRALFASGSPFPPVHFEGRILIPSQGNNAYVFPGVGLGVVASGSKLVPTEMFLTAARALAREVSETDLEEGRLYPPLARIREVSLSIACACAEVAYNRELAVTARPPDLRSEIGGQMYEPKYRDYV
jgi:malate dehydrogenase (oxaloacetate-decarboxylating)(NADP+)